MQTVSNQQTFEQQYREATCDAELGVAKCRKCGRKGAFQDCITVLYGGGVMYSMCVHCAAMGHEIRIARGPKGIHVHGRGPGAPANIGGISGGPGILKQRVG